MNFNTKWLIFLIIGITAVIFADQDPLWLRYPSISPDGKNILFNYKGDIYKVAYSGGVAVPLTISESYDYSAIWSSDGKNIAFASDRYGNFDVFTLPAIGGESQRLTFHSTNEKPSSFSFDNNNILFSAVRQDLNTNVQFPSGVMSELYSVPVSGGRVLQILTSPAHDATISSDGKKLIFHDRKGYENEWRKHHKSSVTRDIWLYDLESKSYTQLSEFAGEDRNPVFDSNNENYYYLSEETGSFNVHKSSLSNPAHSTVLTNFDKHPVRFLSISKDNKLCFSYHGEIYTMTEGEYPQKINIQLQYDGRNTLDRIVSVNEGFTEINIAPNGKEFAYVFRGEIFVSSIEHGTTKRITNTPWQERSVSFSPDGRSLLYAAEVNNSWDVHSKSIAREDDKYFYTSTIFKDEIVIASPAEEFQPYYSPNGEEVAYLMDRTTLNVINLKSKEVRTIVGAEHNYSYSDGDMWYQWSPDSKWFLVQYGPKERVQWWEIGLIEASGKGEILNLTQSGYDDFKPKWGVDGKMVLWGSDREGNRTERGFIRSGDVYGLFFTEEAFDRYNLSEEEFGLIKEEEEKEKEEKEKSDKEKKGKKAKEDESKKVEDLKFDFENLLNRKDRLTKHTSAITDWILSKDGEKLYYLTKFEGKNNLWMTELRKDDTKLFAKINAEKTSMQISNDEKFILVLADGKVIKVDTEEGETKPISTTGEMVLKQADERAYIFDHSWRQVREKFYVVDLHGIDWEYYYTEYKKFLPFINNNYDFTEMLSEMLGELNASHTGSGYRPKHNNDDNTASLGIFYDYSFHEKGIKIIELLGKGPFDNAKSKLKPGDIIEKIDGTYITQSMDFYQLLNRKTDKTVLISIYDPVTKKRWEEVVKPISLRDEGELLYKRWVDKNRKKVNQLSDGRLGYVHVRGMNDQSMRTVIEDALGKHISAEALIVDTRFNGGGNLHDVLSDFLNGKKYMEIVPHGQYVGHQPWNRWIKPSIVIMGESNYSDAHLFPVAYKIKGVGNTLGMPVPGTGTFVWWETQIDPTIYFGIPMGGWRPLGDIFLENNQLEPDILIKNEPGVMAIGRDQQLEAAVFELLK